MSSIGRTLSKHQQTIELAIDLQTDRRIAASELLTLSEVEFTALRRTAMANRVARERTAADARFVCAICRRPLYLSRHIREEGNRWFAHDGASPECPWYEGNRLSPDLHRAMIYRGQQEGEPHRRMKHFLVEWLRKEPGVTEVDPELVTRGQILKGEWKRPDVQCLRYGKRIVIEIQLSYTFLSDVIKRDDFYRQEGIYIIWLFNVLDLRRATVRDEAFFNRRNLFVLDQNAMDESIRTGRLTFSGTFQRPVLAGNSIVDEWQTQFVTLDGIQFPTPSFRPYFFDYDRARLATEERRAAAERKRLEEEREAIRQATLRRRQEAIEQWDALIKRYLAAAVAYYDSDYADGHRQPLLDIAEEMYQSTFWHRGFECLKDDDFFGWHRILPVLLSIRCDRSVGYHKDHTAYQVLEAAVRQTDRGKRHGFTVLYLWASYIYKPTLSFRQRQWRNNLAKDIKRSLEVGELTYRRITRYDEAIGLLFPEMAEKLCSLFATERDNQEAATAA